MIHSFWPPNLSRKRDQIPGNENSLWFQADSAGVYRGQCAEFCGHQHAKMAFLVVAEPPAEFAAWLSQPARYRAHPDRLTGPHAGRMSSSASSCVMCHAISRHTGGQQDRSRSHSPGQPAHHRRRHPAEQPGQPDRLDRGPSGDQARSQDAAQSAQRPRSAGAGGVPGDASNERQHAARAASAARPTRSGHGAELEQTWRNHPGSGAGSPAWTTSPSASATSSRRSSSSCWAASRPRSCGPSWPGRRTRCSAPIAYNQFFTMHGTTMMFLFAVPVMDGGGTLPRSADDRHAQRRVSPAQRLRLLGVPVRRALPLHQLLPEYRAGRRLVQLCPAGRARVLPGEASGRLRPDDHLHRDLRRWSARSS